MFLTVLAAYSTASVKLSSLLSLVSCPSGESLNQYMIHARCGQ